MSLFDSLRAHVGERYCLFKIVNNLSGLYILVNLFFICIVFQCYFVAWNWIVYIAAAVVVPVRSWVVMDILLTGRSSLTTMSPRVTWKMLRVMFILRTFACRWMLSFGAKNTADIIHQRKFVAWIRWYDVIILLLHFNSDLCHWSFICIIKPGKHTLCCELLSQLSLYSTVDPF